MHFYPFSEKTYKFLKYYTKDAGPAIIAAVSATAAVFHEHWGTDPLVFLTVTTLLGIVNIFIKNLLDGSSKVYLEQNPHEEQ